MKNPVITILARAFYNAQIGVADAPKSKSALDRMVRVADVQRRVVAHYGTAVTLKGMRV